MKPDYGAKTKYKFQIRAYTQLGDRLGLVGSSQELGQWEECIFLSTNSNQYPLWTTSQSISFDSKINSHEISYKYLIIKQDGDLSGSLNVIWEEGSKNRWIGIEEIDKGSGLEIMVDDGEFGYIQPYPFSYEINPKIISPKNIDKKAIKIVVIGSSVAAGHKSWRMKGWVSLLAESLYQNYGHELINVSEAGANINTTIARFDEVVIPLNPDIVIIALSLGNEGFATCPAPHRRNVQRRFELGLQKLLKKTQQIGAMPMLGGVYPHNGYGVDHQRMLWDTHKRMLNWGVPVLSWLVDLDNGQGQWREGISFDPAHPNTLGHQIMYEAIAPDLFNITKAQLSPKQARASHLIDIFSDRHGFKVFRDEAQLRITNPTNHEYAIAPDWQEFQTAIQTLGHFTAGIYLSSDPILSYLHIQEDGKIANIINIPAHSHLIYLSAFSYFYSPEDDLELQILFHEGDLGIITFGDKKEADICDRQPCPVWIINESEHEYNIQPMWQEVRKALAKLPSGVYTDTLNPDIPFRTMIIGKDGLESRVKVPPYSALFFDYKSTLSDIQRVAILPLGDRCAVRMMLYKMEYDGPAFPFDLTRSTKISDVADAIATGFEDMWNPQFLEYDSDQHRIYHTKWQGLSFAHEVEESEDPEHDMSPIYNRMRTRYAARARRFWYTLNHCDRVLFVRTGVCDRQGVLDLLKKLKLKSHPKPFQLLILSPQSSDEFMGITEVLHYDYDFNPDQMHDNLDHWLYCTDIMKNILTSLHISSKNLFWCPPHISA